jgi:hypothetical protein
MKLRTSMKLGLLASLIVLGTTVQASGQSLVVPMPATSTEPEAADKVMTAHWYGWSLILSDALTVTAAVAGELLEDDGDGRGDVSTGGLSNAAYTLAGLNYVITPQVLHGVQGSAGSNLLSGMLRLSLPLVGAMVGEKRADCGPSQNVCGLQETAEGFIVGGLIAMVLDASFARTRRRVSDSRDSSASSSGPSLSLSPCTGLEATSESVCNSGSFSLNLSGGF